MYHYLLTLKYFKYLKIRNKWFETLNDINRHYDFLLFANLVCFFLSFLQFFLLFLLPLYSKIFLIKIQLLFVKECWVIDMLENLRLDNIKIRIVFEQVKKRCAYNVGKPIQQLYTPSDILSRLFRPFFQFYQYLNLCIRFCIYCFDSSITEHI